jgi:hypothetical protein
MGYRVVDGRIEVTTAVPGGRATVDLFAGADVPDDVPEEQLAALLATGRIEPEPTEAEAEPAVAKPKTRRKPRKPVEPAGPAEPAGTEPADAGLADSEPGAGSGD